MMFGKLIIVTESNTISEYVQDQVNGLVIKKNPEALREAMNWLMIKDCIAVYQRMQK